MGQDLFNLCKEVYELTEWGLSVTGRRIISYRSSLEFYDVADGSVIDRPYIDSIPLYTSDYLLSKLPQFLTIEGYDCRLEVSPAGYGRKYSRNYTPKRPHVAPWCATYIDKNQTPIRLKSGETPLKALLQLVVALKEAKAL